MVRRASGAVHDFANAPATPPAAPYFKPSRKVCLRLALAEAVLVASGPSELAGLARGESAVVHTTVAIATDSFLLLAFLPRSSEPMKYTVSPGRHAGAHFDNRPCQTCRQSELSRVLHAPKPVEEYETKQEPELSL